MNRWLLCLVIGSVGLLTGACARATSQTPIVQTVVQTVPVEITRNVEVTRLVEVTRDVVVTQVIEMPVTLTPSAPESTPVIITPIPTSAALMNTTPQVTPQEKYTGYTPIFVQNQTGGKMDIYIAGPDKFNLVIWGGDQQKIWAQEGAYVYTVWIDGQESYSGKFNIVSADKYIFLMNGDKAILRVP